MAAAYKKALKRINKAKKSRATDLDLSGLGLKELPKEIGQLPFGQLPNLSGRLGLSNNQFNNFPRAEDFGIKKMTIDQ